MMISYSCLPCQMKQTVIQISIITERTSHIHTKLNDQTNLLGKELRVEIKGERSDCQANVPEEKSAKRCWNIEMKGLDEPQIAGDPDSTIPERFSRVFNDLPLFFNPHFESLAFLNRQVMTHLPTFRCKYNFLLKNVEP